MNESLQLLVFKLRGSLAKSSSPVISEISSLQNPMILKHASICWATSGRVGAMNTIYSFHKGDIDSLPLRSIARHKSDDTNLPCRKPAIEIVHHNCCNESLAEAYSQSTFTNLGSCFLLVHDAAAIMYYQLEAIQACSQTMIA